MSTDLVPFGKYKGKSVVEFLSDKPYVDWCKSQPGLLDKYPQLFNIVHHHVIHTTGSVQDTPSPEHNRIQNLFLDDDPTTRLLKHVTRFDELSAKLESIYDSDVYKAHFGFHRFDLDSAFANNKVTFEAKYNWDLHIKTNGISTEIKSIPFDQMPDYQEFKTKYDVDFDKEVAIFEDKIKLRTEYDTAHQEQCRLYQESYDAIVGKFCQQYHRYCNYDDDDDEYDYFNYDEWVSHAIPQYGQPIDRESHEFNDSWISIIEAHVRCLEELFKNRHKLLSKCEYDKGKLRLRIKDISNHDIFCYHHNISCDHHNLVEKWPYFKARHDNITYFEVERDNTIYSAGYYRGQMEKYKSSYQERLITKFAEYKRPMIGKIFSFCGLNTNINISNDDATFTISLCQYNGLDLCCEIKPLLGDDYPCVLRKMKQQIELMEHHLTKTTSGTFVCWVLLVGKFASDSASREQLVKIFGQANIRVIFVGDIIDSSDQSEDDDTTSVETYLLPKGTCVC